MNKKLFSVAALSLLLAFGFTGCKEDDNEPQKNIVKLGAQSNTTVNSFYSVTESKTYSINEAFLNQAKIDLICFYEHDEANNRINDMTFSSPGKLTGIFTGDAALANWTTKNETKFTAPFIPITVAEYDLISDKNSIIETYYNANASGTGKAKVLKVNDIYAFKTADGTFGLFKVTAVSTPEDENGWVEFELKTYKPTL